MDINDKTVDKSTLGLRVLFASKDNIYLDWLSKEKKKIKSSC